MGHLGVHDDATVDVALQTNGNELVGMRSEILAGEGRAIALITVGRQGVVKTQFTIVIACNTLIIVDDKDIAQRLVEL